MKQMDPHSIRPDFPVFAREIAGRPIAFFDAPAGSQVPRQVTNAVAGYLTLHAGELQVDAVDANEPEPLDRCVGDPGHDHVAGRGM